MKSINDYESNYSANYQYLIFGKIDEYTEEENGNKY